MVNVKKKISTKKKQTENKKIFLILFLFPVILIISYNKFYHIKIHQTAEAVASDLKTIMPSKIKDFKVTNDSIFESNISEITLVDGKLIITSKTSFNPLKNNVEIDYRPQGTDQSSLKLYLNTRFLNLEMIEFILKTPKINTEINEIETDVTDIEMKMNLPLKLFLKKKSNPFDYLKEGVNIELKKMNLVDVKTKKNIYKIDGMSISFKLEEINSVSFKNKVLIGFKKLIVSGEAKTKPSTLTDSELEISIGNFNKVELVKMMSSYDPKQAGQGIQTIMNMGNILENVDINIKHNGTFEKSPFKIDVALKMLETVSLINILKNLELQANFHLPGQVIFQIAKQKTIKSITKTFLDNYQTDSPVSDQEIKQLEMLVSEKISDDLIKSIVKHFLYNGFLKLTGLGLHINLSYSKGEQKIHGILTKLERVDLQFEELVKIFFRGKMDSFMDELNEHFNQNGLVFTKKIISTPQSILIPEIILPSPTAVMPPPAIYPNRNIRSIPINHKPASSLEKVINDKFYQDFRDRKYQDCWVNENVSGYTQIFTVKKFRGNYTDIQADALLAILPAYVKNGQCKLK